MDIHPQLDIVGVTGSSPVTSITCRAAFYMTVAANYMSRRHFKCLKNPEMPCWEGLWRSPWVV